MRHLFDKFILLLIALVLLVLLYFGSRTFVADQFIIPTWSMAPTLVPGDRVVVNKLIMGPRIYTDFDFREGGQELKSLRMRIHRTGRKGNGKGRGHQEVIGSIIPNFATSCNSTTLLLLNIEAPYLTRMVPRIFFKTQRSAPHYTSLQNQNFPTNYYI